MPEQNGRSGPRGGRRMELSVAQVAAAALAAVVGAVLASSLGVYGTVAGAAVVSVGATTGGAVFQHLFHRTGERLRGGAGRADAGPATPEADGASGGWNESGVLRARGRRPGRRGARMRLLAVTGLVFALAMVPIVAVEAVAGKPMHDITTGGSGTGTSFDPGRGTGPASPSASTAPGHAPATAPSGAAGTPSPSRHPSSAAAEPSSPAPSASATASTPADGSAASPAAGPGTEDGTPAPQAPQAAGGASAPAAG